MIAYKGRVGVLGATSIVGEYMLPLLVKEGWEVVAFSRQELYVKRQLGPELYKQALEMNQLDLELYQYGLKLFNDRIVVVS